MGAAATEEASANLPEEAYGITRRNARGLR